MATVTETSVQANPIESPSDFEPEGLYEFIDETFVEKTVSALSIAIANILLRWLGNYSLDNRLGSAWGEMLFRLRSLPRLDRRPDLAFVSNQSWPIDKLPPRTAAWEVVPDLAVEVVSPTNRTYLDEKKIDDYFRAGTKAVWVIFPEAAKIYVYGSPKAATILTRGDTLDASPVIPGFRFELDALFGEPIAEDA